MRACSFACCSADKGRFKTKFSPNLFKTKSFSPGWELEAKANVAERKTRHTAKTAEYLITVNRICVCGSDRIGASLRLYNSLSFRPFLSKGKSILDFRRRLIKSLFF